jgi:alginate O-acetyltransferase complex protein AlgI
MTDNSGTRKAGLVLYDADCRFCTGLALRFARQLKGAGYELAPLQGPQSRAALGLALEHSPDSMRVVTPDGKCLEGADGVAHLAGAIGWARPLWVAAKWPFAMRMMRAGYRWFAARRHCFGGACETRRAGARWRGWVPVALLPAAVLAGPSLPPWAQMWGLAVALFAGFKWLTWWPVRREAAGTTWRRRLGYLLAWPGMDARSFLSDQQQVVRPGADQWAAAASKTALGAVLLWGVARYVADPTAAAWCGLLGLILVLHFGLLHLLALAWQRAGVPAQPLMDRPLASRSLSEFWGKRWNSGFRQLSFEYLFQPALPWLGRAGATLLTFAFSGLLHDLVISVPAGGGFGLPTAYFLLQGCGVLLERSPFGRRLGLGGGWRGWTFAALCTALPAYWLFHPPFVSRVALPFLEVIHAL